MITRRILLLTAQELTVHRFVRRNLVESFAFTNDAAGQDGFGGYMAAHPYEATFLLVDLIEEEFRVDNVPYASGRERAPLHARHAQRLFRTTPFRSALMLERLKEGRRDDRVLFSALTNGEALAPWLERIAVAKAPLGGISSVAHVSSLLLDRLKLHRSHLLLITEEGGAGLRQTFFHDGRLLVSRLAPVTPVHAEAYAALVEEEIERTHRYLQRLQLLPLDAALSVYVITDRPRGAWLGHTLLPADVQLHALDCEEICRHLGATVSTPAHANTLFAHLYAHTGGNRYASDDQLLHARLFRLRNGLARAGMAAGVALLLLSAANLLQIVVDRRATAAVQEEVEHYHRLLASQDPELPSGLNPEELRDAVESAEALSAMNMQPDYALTRLGQVLQDYPEFQIKRLQWGASVNANFSDLGQSVQENGLALAKLPALAEAGAGLYHSVVVHGEIVPFDGDYREALLRFQSLVASLQQLPQVAGVEVLAEPLDKKARFSGSAGTTARADARAPFAFRMVFTP